MRLGIASLALLLALPAAAASLEGAAVQVRNRSEPVLCAEKDNVTLEVANPRIDSFVLEAIHPPYIDTLQRDRFAPDWTACDLSGDPAFPATPRRVTIYESFDLWVVGFTFPSFWRPATVPVTIGDRREEGLHMLQVWVRHEDRAEEVLVLYAPDGYWRARPLPPKHLGWSAYGSSFLIGPVEDLGRPVVRFTDITFDPAAKRFEVGFAGGGRASIQIAALDREQQRLEIRFTGALPDRPFAALRSMYITEFNNDAARVAARGPGAPGWLEAPVMTYPGGAATDLWLGRLVPSRHNTSAPDMVLRAFRER